MSVIASSISDLSSCHISESAFDTIIRTHQPASVEQSQNMLGSAKVAGVATVNPGILLTEINLANVGSVQPAGNTAMGVNGDLSSLVETGLQHIFYSADFLQQDSSVLYILPKNKTAPDAANVAQFLQKDFLPVMNLRRGESNFSGNEGGLNTLLKAVSLNKKPSAIIAQIHPNDTAPISIDGESVGRSLYIVSAPGISARFDGSSLFAFKTKNARIADRKWVVSKSKGGEELPADMFVIIPEPGDSNKFIHTPVPFRDRRPPDLETDPIMPHFGG
jgi:hypothetical protein